MNGVHNLMKNRHLGVSGLEVSAIAMGSTGLVNLSLPEAQNLLDKALSLGVNYFDHADGYGRGRCEEIFGEAMNLNDPTIREHIYVQTKCGNVHMKMYDLSKEHILKSVDGSLKRLNTDYLDALVLHKPDTLMEPESIAEAFDLLLHSGKVRHFGVSNFYPYQIDLLKKYINMPIIVNQLQLSLTDASLIATGLAVNTNYDDGINRDGGVLEYCRLHDITIQTWSPFKSGSDIREIYLNNNKYPELNAKINEYADKYSVEQETIVIAWILRHPAGMQPIVGTTNARRLESCVKACDVELTREEWYALYKAAGHILP
jgi:predicted oxidoreductase